MSLYGALYTGVTGLDTQGQKIGIISDNIANVNTVGYKESEAQFETLVINSSLRSSYAPGGVRQETRTNIDKQGIITSTAAPTDVAVSGEGFFVVNASTDSSGQPLYTRAGSFRQDAQGNFRNSQGFYLQGWPLDQDGRLPGDPGNLNQVSSGTTDSLQTVNVESASGVAQATTDVDLGINLNAGQEVLPGAAGVITMDIQSPTNYQIDSTTIIAPDEFSATPPSFALATANNIARGDQFTVSTGAGLSYDYEYGGFTIGRKITDSDLMTNTGDRNTDLSPTNLAGAGGGITINNGDQFYTVDFGSAHGLNPGDTFLLSNVVLAGASSVPAAEFNGVVTVASTPTANTFTVATTVVEAQPGTTATVAAEGNLRVFEGNIFDAISENQAFFGADTNLADYTDAALQFTITSPSISEGTITYSYKAASPDTSLNQFNSLATLSEAINNAAGLTSRVQDGRLLVGSSDANQSVTFANVDDAGTATQSGLNWVQELDLQDVALGARRFSNMNNLATIVNGDPGVSATITNPLSESSLSILVDDPLDTIRFEDFAGPLVPLQTDPVQAGGVVIPGAGGAGTADITITQNGHAFAVGNNVLLSGLTDLGAALPSLITAAELNASHTITAVTATTYTFTINTAATVVPAIPGGGGVGMVQSTNIGSLLGELGLVTSLNGAAYTRGDTGNIGPVYDAAGANGGNMASGAVEPHFSRTVRIYDALGSGHDLRVGFLKTGENEWAVEVYSTNPDEVSVTNDNGQITAGTITFNGDASLRTVANALINPITISWTNGAIASTIDLGLGNAGSPFGTEGALTIGDTSGLSQFDSDYNVAFINQNGAPVGELISVIIDEAGFVVASYSNGESDQLFKLPLADFSNPNGLTPISGNVYAENTDSGELILREAGSNGIGDIVSSALEASNVDLAEQLTDMIVAQRAYQANTRVISTSDELLEQLTQI